MLAVSVLSCLSISAFAASTATETPVAMVTETVVTETFSPIFDIIYDHPILSQLNLSNQQKAQLNKIDHQYGNQRPVMSNQNRQILANLRQDRNNLVLNKAFDETKARNVIAQEQRIWAQQQQAQDEFEFLQLKREHEIYQILTPMQQQHYLRLREQLQQQKKFNKK